MLHFLELNVVSNVIFRNYSSKHNGFLAYFSRLDMELQERVGFMLLLLYKRLQFAIMYAPVLQLYLQYGLVKAKKEDMVSI